MSRLLVGLCPNLTMTVYERLRLAGIRNVADFFKQDFDDLAASTGVAYRDLIVIRRTLLAGHSAPVISGQSAFDDVIASTSIISTGCVQLDHLLDGGLLTGEVVELVTNDCRSLNRIEADVGLRIAAEVSTVANKTVIWFDAARRFDVNRLAEFVRVLSTAKQPSPSSRTLHRPSQVHASLKNVRVVEVFDLFDLITKLSSLSADLGSRLDTFSSSTKLIILDGVVESILMTSLGGAIPPDECRGYVDQLVRQLRQLAHEFSVSVLLLSLSTAAMRSGYHYHGRSKDSATVIGRSWSDVAGTRIEVSCGLDTSPLTAVPSCSVSGKFMVTRSGRLKTGQFAIVDLNEFFLASFIGDMVDRADSMA